MGDYTRKVKIKHLVNEEKLRKQPIQDVNKNYLRCGTCKECLSSWGPERWVSG